MPLVDIVRQRARDVAVTLSSRRVLLYTLVSTIAVSSAILNALRSHSNFYSVTIFLSKSSRSVLILTNFGFILVLFCGRLIQQLFFGTLRPLEVERLYDRLWFFITESLLAFTIFRDEFDIPFALMFAFLLFIKSFHWLAGDRIEWMDQTPYPGPSLLFHIRILSLFAILWSIDFAMFVFAVENTLMNGVGGMVLFASEHAILMASLLNAAAKYVLTAYDIRRARTRGGENAPPWENKSMWLFYIELATDFLKLATYLVFFTIIITTYGLPLNIIRDVYITARSFVTRLGAFRRYQAATRNMDERYPNATEAEMSAMEDKTCIICREEMVLRSSTDQETPNPATRDGPNTTPKKLPCGHVFHFHCLRSWLERQQSCPTCRRPVLETGNQQNTPQPRPARQNPVPGPNPQPANPLAGAQAGVPPNNRAGWFGRLLFNGNGNLPQVPIAHGQHHAPFAGGQGQPGGAILQNGPHLPNAGLAQAPGQQMFPAANVIIQYHIPFDPRHYQAQQARPQGATLHGSSQQAPAVPPQGEPQPLPMFGGFYGPGGAWQPWGMDGRWFGQGQVPPNTTNQNQAPGASSAVNNQSNTSVNSTAKATPLPANGALSQPPPGHVAREPSASTGSTSTTPQVETITETSTSASTNGSSHPADETSYFPRVNVQSTSSTLSTSGSQPGPSTTVAVPQASVNGNSAHDTGANRFQIPTVIPLHDFGTPQNQLPSQHPPQNASRTHMHPIYARVHTGARAVGHPYQHQQPPASTIRTSLRRSQPSQAPISQLPPALTDEQLASMDRITREAIDERLRVLEGVNGAISRCIEDLQRVKNTLPVTPTPRNIPNSTLQAQSESQPQKETTILSGSTIDPSSSSLHAGGKVSKGNNQDEGSTAAGPSTSKPPEDTSSFT